MRSIMQILALAAILAAATGTRAAEQPGFWDLLKTKLEGIAPTRKTTVTTAVGGVRGAKNEPGQEIYWKGKTDGIQVGEDELASMRLALQAGASGKNEEAVQLFEKFLSDFPASALREDAQNAMSELKKAPVVQPVEPAAK